MTERCLELIIHPPLNVSHLFLYGRGGFFEKKCAVVEAVYNLGPTYVVF